MNLYHQHAKAVESTLKIDLRKPPNCFAWDPKHLDAVHMSRLLKNVPTTTLKIRM